eukprot:sb/3478041/
MAQLLTSYNNLKSLLRIKGTPGVFQRRVPNLTTSPGFRPYKMDLKYAILAQNFNRFFCYSINDHCPCMENSRGLTLRLPRRASPQSSSYWNLARWNAGDIALR